MKIVLHLALVALLGLSGCALVQKIPYTVEVRRNSVTSDVLFADILGAVMRIDRRQYPEVAQRTLQKVEAIAHAQYFHENHPGVERWTVLHDGENPVVYLITITPDNEGYASFVISQDGGSAPQ
ncbi:MAG: hypothetical protein K9M98_03950 [Cephaloticoccus sp.]|nr:hypothetical protein [Cephaloticoccus sp.]MCF7759636.1 hypothetical protein [Cephaloticoccus sp.]